MSVTSLLSFSLLALVASATPLLEARTSSGDIAAYLNGHNTLRAQHGAAAVTWNNDLANFAQNYVNGCKFQHSGGPHGENLAAGSGAYSIAQALNSWATEPYNPSNPQPSHFTQMVWKNTKQIGCAVKTCPAGSIFPVEYGTAQFYACEYDPPGNVIGQFPQNVQ